MVTTTSSVLFISLRVGFKNHLLENEHNFLWHIIKGSTLIISNTVIVHLQASDYTFIFNFFRKKDKNKPNATSYLGILYKLVIKRVLYFYFLYKDTTLFLMCKKIV